MVKINCKQCDKEFYIRKSRDGKAKYCSRKCASKCRPKKGRKAITDRVCQFCSNEFTIPNAWLRKRSNSGMYCSRMCSSLARRKGKYIYCSICDKRFYVPANQLAKRRFCSTQCRGKQKSIDQIGQNNPYWRGGVSSSKCEYCGNIFSFYKSRNVARFCSIQCRSKELSGANSPTWKGGKSFEPYPSTFNEPFKRMIRERDNYTCAVCRMNGKSVHHINYVKDDTTPDNCITLCAKCHGTMSTNRGYWQNALIEIVQARTT